MLFLQQSFFLQPFFFVLLMLFLQQSFFVLLMLFLQQSFFCSANAFSSAILFCSANAFSSVLTSSTNLSNVILIFFVCKYTLSISFDKTFSSEFSSCKEVLDFSINPVILFNSFKSSISI